MKIAGLAAFILSLVIWSLPLKAQNCQQSPGVAYVPVFYLTDAQNEQLSGTTTQGRMVYLNLGDREGLGEHDTTLGLELLDLLDLGLYRYGWANKFEIKWFYLIFDDCYEHHYFYDRQKGTVSSDSKVEFFHVTDAMIQAAAHKGGSLTELNKYGATTKLKRRK